MSEPDVLVVEDDPDMADAMLRLLRHAGFRARSAENGKRALEAVEAHRPAVVLLDILMPVMDGWECARRLRARYGTGLPIVVVTAAEHVEARCEEVGADHLLPKPFELAELLELVTHYANPGEADGEGRASR